MEKAFFVTIPHSGERVPEDCTWLQGLPEEVLMCDVDRYVDRLYEASLLSLEIPSVKTQWHRYAADLNRIPADVDCESVEGNLQKPGTQSRGFHWVVTTTQIRLMKQPMPLSLHEKLVRQIYEPFHAEVEKQYLAYRSQGHQKIYHLDAHSMPSRGTSQHRDPGEQRAEIVVSDCHGKSCDPKFTDLVLAAYSRAGFKVGYNWPYFGGRVSEQYGQPQKFQHAIQVELNRSLYMDETNKKWLAPQALEVQNKIKKALDYIVKEL